jgi:hypothetical protein
LFDRSSNSRLLAAPIVVGCWKMNCGVPSVNARAASHCVRVVNSCSIRHRAVMKSERSG